MTIPAVYYTYTPLGIMCTPYVCTETYTVVLISFVNNTCVAVARYDANPGVVYTYAYVSDKGNLQYAYICLSLIHTMWVCTQRVFYIVWILFI